MRVASRCSKYKKKGISSIDEMSSKVRASGASEASALTFVQEKGKPEMC